MQWSPSMHAFCLVVPAFALDRCTLLQMISCSGVVLLASCIYGIPVEDADLTDKIVQNEATTKDSIVEIFTHSHEDESLSTPEQKERARAELQELQTEVGGSCAWTRQHSCPGQQLGSQGCANADGSAGYRECCLHGGWRKVSQGYTVAEFNAAVTSKGCVAPLQFSSCVHSSWHNWKNERSKFQAQCKGVLIGFGNGDKAQDCNRACWGCSFIRACCDTCDTIFRIEPQYINLGHTSVPKTLSQETGVETSSSGSWSQTETWSKSVTAGFSNGEQAGFHGSATIGHELSVSQSYSWSETKSSKTTVTFQQPAHTTAWGFQWKITDSCGIKYAHTRDFVTTKTSSPPKCLPGRFATPDGSLTAPTRCRDAASKIT